MDALRAEYENGSAAFVRQIDFLVKSGFGGVRRSRGDGNCFYRCTSFSHLLWLSPISQHSAQTLTHCIALAFAYVERLLYAPDDELAVGSALSTLEGSLALLDAAGFQKMVYEDFYEPLAELVRSVIAPDQNGATLSPPALLQAFQSAEGAIHPSTPSFLLLFLARRLDEILTRPRSVQQRCRLPPPARVRADPCRSGHVRALSLPPRDGRPATDPQLL
jgi:hypothetical protein